MPASPRGYTVLTSTSDINGSGRQHSQAVWHGQPGRVAPRGYRGAIELPMRCSRASALPGRPRAVEGHSMVTNVDRCRQLGSRSGSRQIRRPQVTAADDQLWLCSS